MIIAYGIQSEGMGHVTRSSVVIDYLLSKGHEVHVFTAGRPYELLSKKYPNMNKVQGFSLIYKDGSLDTTKSTIIAIKEVQKKSLSVIQSTLDAFERIKPNVVITDFETFTALAARRKGIPLISANNISITLD